MMGFMQYISQINCNKINITMIRKPKEIGISILKKKGKPNKLINFHLQRIKHTDGSNLLII